ncbi:SDR family oxidoreductase [Streptomyces albospinus]|uniref:SDR family oxidoreductase n=1 Tax=Streptomyces albospinus TaxID=285515 RepID=UPI0027E44EDE|nr:SDR family oxidoreductase [Streptomyces albospinus]
MRVPPDACPPNPKVRFGAQGVRVNAVAPGPVSTPGTEEMGSEPFQVFGRTTVLGRVADPEEIAEAVLFLASSRTSNITGAVLEARGGQLAIG